MKACIEEGAHYVDITGEPEFFEAMTLKYHEKAKEAQVAIVHVCGFDSIPADMGVLYTKQQLEKNHNALPSTIEMFFKLHIAGNSGFGGHYATYASVSRRPWGDQIQSTSMDQTCYIDTHTYTHTQVVFFIPLTDLMNAFFFL